MDGTSGDAPLTTLAWAAPGPNSPLAPWNLTRRAPGPGDVAFDILFCGVCHSDLHTARGEWSGTVYPCVPGHEIIGRVTRVGSSVSAFKPGELVGVGCMVDSCRTCRSCREGEEQYCENHQVTWTYNSADQHFPGCVTYGGYSSWMVVDQAFCLQIPATLDPAAAAPLLCAGITTWSPLRHWGAGPGRKVGIVGLGGLGHMGVKLSHALGAETVIFTRSPAKAADGGRLGADDVVISTDPTQMSRHTGSFDLILDTVAASHDLDAYTVLLRRDGALVLVGIPQHPHPAPSVGALIGKRRSIAGSVIGGIRETQAMLDFCARNGIASDIELIPIQRINQAYDRMLRSEVRYRFVIDLASLGTGAG